MTIDLPTNDAGGLIYAGNPGGDLWGAWWEKALAHYRNGLDSYLSLNAGWPDAVCRAITGDHAYTEWVVNLDIGGYLADALAEGWAITLASQREDVGRVIGNHVYAVTGADADGLETYNPHGHYVTFTWAEIQAGFRLVTEVTP